MTDEPEDNVVSLDEVREAQRENPWRVTAVRYKKGQALIKRPDGSMEPVPTFDLNIQFLDREESRLVTNHQAKGYKDFTIPIPITLPVEGLYEMLRGLPEQIQAHLDGVAPPTNSDPPDAG